MSLAQSSHRTALYLACRRAVSPSLIRALSLALLSHRDAELGSWKIHE
jgi:hypothetical protein